MNSTYCSIEDFDLNKTLQEVSQEHVPVSRLYPEPIPAIFVTPIISYCPPNTFNMLWLPSLQETGDLCFITKSRRPISRDEIVVILFTQELKNVYFDLSEICARQIFPNFLAWYATLYAPYGNFFLQEQLTY